MSVKLIYNVDDPTHPFPVPGIIIWPENESEDRLIRQKTVIVNGQRVTYSYHPYFCECLTVSNDRTTKLTVIKQCRRAKNQILGDPPLIEERNKFCGGHQPSSKTPCGQNPSSIKVQDTLPSYSGPALSASPPVPVYVQSPALQVQSRPPSPAPPLPLLSPSPARLPSPAPAQQFTRTAQPVFSPPPAPHNNASWLLSPPPYESPQLPSPPARYVPPQAVEAPYVPSPQFVQPPPPPLPPQPGLLNTVFGFIGLGARPPPVDPRIREAALASEQAQQKALQIEREREERIRLRNIEREELEMAMRRPISPTVSPQRELARVISVPVSVPQVPVSVPQQISPGPLETEAEILQQRAAEISGSPPQTLETLSPVPAVLLQQAETLAERVEVAVVGPPPLPPLSPLPRPPSPRPPSPLSPQYQPPSPPRSAASEALPSLSPGTPIILLPDVRLSSPEIRQSPPEAPPPPPPRFLGLSAEEQEQVQQASPAPSYSPLASPPSVMFARNSGRTQPPESAVKVELQQTFAEPSVFSPPSAPPPAPPSAAQPAPSPPPAPPSVPAAAPPSVPAAAQVPPPERKISQQCYLFFEMVSINDLPNMKSDVADLIQYLLGYEFKFYDELDPLDNRDRRTSFPEISWNLAPVNYYDIPKSDDAGVLLVVGKVPEVLAVLIADILNIRIKFDPRYAHKNYRQTYIRCLK